MMRRRSKLNENKATGGVSAGRSDHANLVVKARRAFTMVELLIVITIIIILAALILPAINSGLIRARQTRGGMEVNDIVTAVEKFRNDYGVYPPSRIRLREGTKYQLTDPFDAHSVRYLKRIWPNILIETDGTGPTQGVTNVISRKLWCKEDPNEDETNCNDTYDLEGDECLVFFLGGIAEFDANNLNSPIILHGFSKRSTNPAGVPDARFPQSIERQDKSFEFDAGRLFRRVNAANMVMGSAANANAGDFPNAERDGLLPSYRSINSQSGDKPIAYFSSYEGQGYRACDVSIPESDPILTASLPAGDNIDNHDYQVLWPVRMLADRGDASSSPPYPYTITQPNPPQTGNVLPVVKFHNPQTFQIIVPGDDNLYGPGDMLPRSQGAGQYDADLRSAGPSYDNFTNISGAQILGIYNEVQSTK